MHGVYLCDQNPNLGVQLAIEEADCEFYQQLSDATTKAIGEFVDLLGQYKEDASVKSLCSDLTKIAYSDADDTTFVKGVIERLSGLKISEAKEIENKRITIIAHLLFLYFPEEIPSNSESKSSE